MNFLSKRRKNILPLFLLFPFILAFVNHPFCDRSRDFSSYNYGEKVLSMLPPHSIVFTNHKDRIFIFWYLQLVEGKRKDVVFLSIESLKRPTYLRRMRKLHPQINFPTEEDVKKFVRITMEKRYPPVTIVYMIIEDIIEKNIHSHPIYANVIFPQRKFKFVPLPPIYRISPK